MIPEVIGVDETSKEVQKRKKLRDFSFPSLFLRDRKDFESAARQINILPLTICHILLNPVVLGFPFSLKPLIHFSPVSSFEKENLYYFSNGKLALLGCEKENLA